MRQTFFSKRAAAAMVDDSIYNHRIARLVARFCILSPAVAFQTWQRLSTGRPPGG
jgi:hypothetical protein